MKLRLRRFSNLFCRDVFVTVLLLGGLFFLAPTLLILLSEITYVFLLPLWAFDLLLFFTYLFGFPARAQINGGVLSYTEYYEISKGERKKIHFAVTDVRDVEYVQNKLERKLNIGRIYFRGNAEMDPVYPLKENRATILRLCGITDFEAFREQFEGLMNNK